MVIGFAGILLVGIVAPALAQALPGQIKYMNPSKSLGQILDFRYPDKQYWWNFEIPHGLADKSYKPYVGDKVTMELTPIGRTAMGVTYVPPHDPCSTPAAKAKTAAFNAEVKAAADRAAYDASPAGKAAAAKAAADRAAAEKAADGYAVFKPEKPNVFKPEKGN